LEGKAKKGEIEKHTFRLRQAIKTNDSQSLALGYFSDAFNFHSSVYPNKKYFYICPLIRGISSVG
jgi:hypothetical protein